MIYIICALEIEARAIIEHFRLKKSSQFAFVTYKNDEIVVAISGIGRDNAIIATSAICGFYAPKPSDIIINIGICGGGDEVGRAFLIHKIIDRDRDYYPDILFSHALVESSIECVGSSIESPQNHLVDMESGGVFVAASRFFKLHQIAFIKIISDNFNPQGVTKELVDNLMRQNLVPVLETIESLKNSTIKNQIFSDDEQHSIDRVLGFFSVTEQNRLKNSIYFYRFRDSARELYLDIDEPKNKRERRELYEKLISKFEAI